MSAPFRLPSASSLSAHRLAVQDVALSRRKQGFDSPWARPNYHTSKFLVLPQDNILKACHFGSKFDARSCPLGQLVVMLFPDQECVT
jgi:hypothetical protein